MKTLNKWDNRFIEIAKSVSLWSKDPSKQVGAVLVGQNKQVISQGYNGFVRGKDVDERPELYADREYKLLHIVHAEANAIYNAFGKDVKGSTIYVWGLPTCHECAKALIQVGISRVVCPSIIPNSKWEKSCAIALEMFKSTGVEVVFYNEQ